MARPRRRPRHPRLRVAFIVIASVGLFCGLLAGAGWLFLPGLLAGYPAERYEQPTRVALELSGGTDATASVTAGTGWVKLGVFDRSDHLTLVTPDGRSRSTIRLEESELAPDAAGLAALRADGAEPPGLVWGTETLSSGLEATHSTFATDRSDVIVAVIEQPEAREGRAHPVVVVQVTVPSGEGGRYLTVAADLAASIRMT